MSELGGVTGLGVLAAAIDRILQEATSGAERGAQLAAEQVLTTARRYVPIEEGTLERSGKASTRFEGERLYGVITFGTPCAVRQHEDMTLRHDAGRTAKYLERALAEEKDVVREIVAQAIRDYIAGKG